MFINEYISYVKKKLIILGFTEEKSNYLVNRFDKIIKEKQKDHNHYEQTTKLICKLWVESL